jgi:hypothetical protein
MILRTAAFNRPILMNLNEKLRGHIDLLTHKSRIAIQVRHSNIENDPKLTGSENLVCQESKSCEDCGNSETDCSYGVTITQKQLPEQQIRPSVSIHWN